ncbi:cadherin-related family member 4-like [Alligator mississippiensis]|uniref:Cadherin-related family member 4-like n=1 Tax=Alligator mississippiensis TaxID=8496 RepID=A0A151NPD4_ALLMI|nr:cadherin-related family member 4-like [Alligator mississippiensis]
MFLKLISKVFADLLFTINPVNLNETIPAGTELSRAYDPVVVGRRNSYSIVGNSEEFSIDSGSGVIRSNKVFNFETDPKTYELIIESKLFVHKERKRLVINIIDIPEETVCTDPQFIEGTAFAAIDENYPIFQSIYRVMATDEDTANGERLTYSMETQSSMPAEGGNFFMVDSATGIVSRNSEEPLDFDAGYHSFHLVMRAADTTGHFCQGTLTVIIQDLNDERPEFVPFPLDSINVTENVPVGTIITRVNATDRDANSNIIYAFSTPQTVFCLDPNTGSIILLQPLDFDNPEKPKVYPLHLEAKDNGNSHTAFYTFVIAVQNVDDPPICDPGFSTGTGISISVPETIPASTAVYTVLARDPDPGETLEFSLLHSSANTTTYFLLDPDNGMVYKTPESVLDYEMDHKHFQMVVAAKDKEKITPRSCTGTITINIQNVNDEAPLFVIKLPETVPLGSHLVTLKCKDRDGTDPNNLLTYNLMLDELSNETFTLNTNEIKIGPKRLNYDSVAFAGVQFKHTLIVQVSDGGMPSQTSTVTIIVKVIRINELAPSASSNIFSVFENSKIDTLVGRVKITDQDWPFNNLKYIISGGNMGVPPRFYLEPDTGVIKVLNALDSETNSQYFITLKVIDMNNDIELDPIREKFTLADVTVNVLNVNDEPPVCSPPYFNTFIYSTVKTPFFQLNCSDKDSPPDQLSYSIVGGNTNNWFTLERLRNGSPSLVTTQNFQYEAFQGIQDTTALQLLIEVTDELGGIKASQLTTTATVIVHVIPWTTTQPSTSTSVTVTTITKTALVRISRYWSPDNWLPAILTITAFLFLLNLYAMARCFFKNVPRCKRFFPQCSTYQPSPQLPAIEKADNIKRKMDLVDRPLKSNPRKPLLPGNSSAPVIYDGRAIDAVTGKHYLFNSKTGETQWLDQYEKTSAREY